MRSLLFCVVVLGCGAKPAPPLVPESGQYAVNATYSEIVCTPFLDADVGEPYEPFLIDVERLEDGSIHLGTYDECALDNGTSVCSRAVESEGTNPLKDTYYFYDLDLEVVWESTTTGHGTFVSAWVCEGADCDQSNDGCPEGYWSLELYLTRLGDLSED